jgi:serine/threonine protein kinase
MTLKVSSHFEDRKQIGPFRIVETLGMGGMAKVYLGERMESFSQRVAIKVLHPETTVTEDVSSSIGREGHVLMSLDHTNIVRLLDRGVSQEGRQYLVMEYVQGTPIDEFCDRQRLSVRARVELLLKVMDAVEYAHRRLVVHSDLKPANILVPADGEPKLLDFGVASMLQERRSRRVATGVSADGYTAAFASPEQLAGERLTVASDVYTLGIVAGAVIAGLKPARGLSGQNPTSMTAVLMGLSTDKLAEIAAARLTTPAGLIASLSGDLDSIVAKAQQRVPDNRFHNVEEFGADLRLYLEGRPIASRRTSVIDQTGKWVQRHRLAAVLGVVFLLAVIFGGVGVAWQTAHAAQQRRIAQTRLHDLVRLTGELEGELYDSVSSLPHAESAKRSLIDGANGTLDKLAADGDKDPGLAVELAQQYERLALLQMAQTGGSQPDSAIRLRALADVEKALFLLKNIPASDAHYVDAQAKISRLAPLQRQISPP